MVTTKDSRKSVGNYETPLLLAPMICLRMNLTYDTVTVFLLQWTSIMDEGMWYDEGLLICRWTVVPANWVHALTPKSMFAQERERGIERER